MVKAGSPIESSSAICSDASRDASRARPDMSSSITGPVMPTASEALSLAALHNSRSSSKGTETLNRHGRR